MSEPAYSIEEIRHLAHLLGYEVGGTSERGVGFIRVNPQGVLPDMVTIVATSPSGGVPEAEVVALFQDAGNSRDFIYEMLAQVRP